MEKCRYGQDAGQAQMFTMGMEQKNDNFLITYAAFCFTGKVRQNNEDNLCILGQYLPAVHQDLDHIVSRQVSCDDRPVFGVFDGMGGESCGEVASYLGAKTFSETFCHPYEAAASAAGVWKKQEKTVVIYPKRMHGAPESGKMEDPGTSESIQSKGHRTSGSGWKTPEASGAKEKAVNNADEILMASILAANNAVCDYAARNRISVMGTTAAVVTFSEGKVFCGNVGDSRIYLYRDGHLAQVSVDHSVRSIFGKGGLTQFIGIPPQEMQIEPELNSWPVLSSLRVLICSDGVTNMLSDEELSHLVGQPGKPEKILNAMQQEILNRGAIDNATAVLCEVC